MRRREFITSLAISAAWPIAARAQQTTGRIAHIAYLGVLGPSTLDPRQIEGFKEGLRENGLIEGRNVTVDYLWAEGSQDRLRQLAEDLAKRSLDIIVTAGPLAVLHRACRTSSPAFDMGRHYLRQGRRFTRIRAELSRYVPSLGGLRSKNFERYETGGSSS